MVAGCFPAFSFNFVYYIIRHQTDKRTARRAINGLRDVFVVVGVDARSINQAVDAGFLGFEDAVQHALAVRAKTTPLAMRDVVGLQRSEVPAHAAEDYLPTGPKN